MQNRRLVTLLTEDEYENFQSDQEVTHFSRLASHSSDEVSRRKGKKQCYSIHNIPRHTTPLQVETYVSTAVKKRLAKRGIALIDGTKD